MDAVVNVAGYSLAHWPWTRGRKLRFIDSRVDPTRALADAVVRSRSRPSVFLQTSGVNYYGLQSESIADEATPPAEDFLAQLTVAWEAASEEVEAAGGVRRIIMRNAVVLDANRGLLPVMTLPTRLFLGGRLGAGSQALCWIHIVDYLEAALFLIENPLARGAYNVVSPEPTSSVQFTRALAATLRRPDWLPAPAALLRLVLGEMSVLVSAGRYCRPRRLEEAGFRFHFREIESALGNLYGVEPASVRSQGA